MAKGSSGFTSGPEKGGGKEELKFKNKWRFKMRSGRSKSNGRETDCWLNVYRRNRIECQHYNGSKRKMQKFYKLSYLRSKSSGGGNESGKKGREMKKNTDKGRCDGFLGASLVDPVNRNPPAILIKSI